MNVAATAPVVSLRDRHVVDGEALGLDSVGTDRGRRQRRRECDEECEECGPQDHSLLAQEGQREEDSPPRGGSCPPATAKCSRWSSQHDGHPVPRDDVRRDERRAEDEQRRDGRRRHERHGFVGLAAVTSCPPELASTRLAPRGLALLGRALRSGEPGRRCTLDLASRRCFFSRAARRAAFARAAARWAARISAAVGPDAGGGRETTGGGGGACTPAAAAPGTPAAAARRSTGGGGGGGVFLTGGGSGLGAVDDAATPSTATSPAARISASASARNHPSLYPPSHLPHLAAPPHRKKQMNVLCRRIARFSPVWEWAERPCRLGPPALASIVCGRDSRSPQRRSHLPRSGPRDAAGGRPPDRADRPRLERPQDQGRRRRLRARPRWRSRSRGRRGRSSCAAATASR